jgi:acetyl-CoA synthetase
MAPSPSTTAYRQARDTLVSLTGKHDEAVRAFRWPEVGERFNWAIDWFDAVARGNDTTALWIVEEDGSEQRLSFDELARR